MPIRDNDIKIMIAKPISFYNVTTNNNGQQIICWMTYKGPRYLIYNTTNECLSEVIDSKTDNGAVRAQTCAGKEDEMEEQVNLWRKEYCLKPNQLSADKRKIQVVENYGKHIIYCYLHNITIDETTMACPDYPFELDSRKTYRIANIDHLGEEHSIRSVKDTDEKISRIILSRMKIETVSAKALNLSLFDDTYSKYISTLSLLPKDIKLYQPQQSTISGFFASLFDGLMSWLHKLGIILAVIALIVLLGIMAPFIQVLLILFKLIVKFTWAIGSNFSGLLSDWKSTFQHVVKQTKKERRNWRDEYKRLV